jgi:hypothetical protein
MTPGDEKGDEKGAEPALPGLWAASRALVDESDKGRLIEPGALAEGRLVVVPKANIDAVRAALRTPPRGPDSAREALTEAAKRIEAIEQAAAYVAGCLPSQEMAHAASRLRQLCSDFRWWCRAALTGGKARDE